MPRLSRKTPRRQFYPLRPPASADLYEGLETATPVTQIDPEVSKAPRLSRKTARRQFDPLRPPASADLYEGLQSATPVTQIDPEVSKVCHACHAKQRGVNSTHFVRQLPQTSMKVYKVPHLSRKSTLRSLKCHACHAKQRGVNSTHFVRQLPPTSMKV